MNLSGRRADQGRLLEDLCHRVGTPTADRPKVSSAHAMFQLMMMLAAPRLLAGRFVSDQVIAWMREGLWRRILDQYLGTLYRVRRGLEDEPEDLLRTERAARRARAPLTPWIFSRTAPEPLVLAARELFAAFGWPEQKWDEVEVPLSRGLDPALFAAIQSKEGEAAPLNDAALTGTFFPCEGEQRVVVVMAATQRAYLPCFRTEAKLRELMERLGFPFDRVERIEDGHAFADSLGTGTGDLVLRLALDPHLIPGPGMRWAELERDFALESGPVIIHMLAFEARPVRVRTLDVSGRRELPE